MSVTLSLEQARAADAVGDWLKKRDKPYFILHGLAGTGKSTVAETLAALHKGTSYFMTYTGRAAQVLRKKGVPCRTIHSHIYLPLDDRKEEAEALETELQKCTDAKRQRKIRVRLEELYSPEFVKRGESPFDSGGLIVLDECSMVARTEAEDLLSFGVPVLVLGDPGQLPPIEGQGYFNKNPDFVLTEIHRQAKDSPIIQLAHKARKGERLAFGNYGTSRIIKKTEITPALIEGIEQIATGRNNSRREFNSEVRALKGFKKEYPEKGERLMCLRNNKNHMIFNGQVFEAVEEAELNPVTGFVEVTVKDETDAPPLDLNVHEACFSEPDSLKAWSYQRRKTANEFDYSYAATIHKLQGGQFDSVLVYPDLFNWSGAQEKYRQLLYTGITRAIDRVVVAL